MSYGFHSAGRRHAFTACAAWAFTSGFYGSAATAPAAAIAIPPEAAPAIKEMLAGHCFGCHSSRQQEGGVRLDDLSFSIDNVATAERWQQVVNVINSGAMPPDDADQPKAEEVAEFLDVLSVTLASARSRLGDAGGGSPMRRLNRREYRNAVRSLLGIDLDVRDLPEDTASGTYDTSASALFMSSGQFEQYLKLARIAWSEFFARQQAAIHSTEKTSHVQLRIEPEDAANRRVSDAQARLQDRFGAFTRWSAALDEHAARTMAKEVVAQLRENSNAWRHPHEYYRQVAASPAAPDPRSYGFADGVSAVGLAGAIVKSCVQGI